MYILYTFFILSRLGKYSILLIYYELFAYFHILFFHNEVCTSKGNNKLKKEWEEYLKIWSEI